MQTILDFSESQNQLFRQFVELKKAEGYTANKVNYSACATILTKEKHQISIYPKSDRSAVMITEYEIGEKRFVPPPAYGPRAAMDVIPTEGKLEYSFHIGISYELTSKQINPAQATTQH